MSYGADITDPANFEVSGPTMHRNEVDGDNTASLFMYLNYWIIRFFVHEVAVDSGSTVWARFRPCLFL